MKEYIQKHPWLSLTGLILLITVLLWGFAVPAPIIVILCWVTLIVGLPILYDSRGRTFDFWVYFVGKNGIKTGLCLLIFFLIRAFFTHMLSKSTFESWTTFSEGTGASSLFGYTPGVVLFELTFTLLAGAMIIQAFFNIFNSLKWRNVAIGSIAACLLIAFSFQVFIYGAGEVASQVRQPLSQDKVAANIAANSEDHGALGAGWIAFRTGLFGKPKPASDRGWETIFTREYTGQGFGSNDWVPTANFGQDIKIGDRVVVEGKNLKVHNMGTWEDHPNGYLSENYNGTSGALGVMTDKGAQFTVRIQRRS